jgi:hypothetical protein
MTLRSCTHEAELRQLLQLGHWPHSCTAELRAHVEGCGSCADLVLVTMALRGARTETMQTARLVPPGVLWWRAQLQRRNAAVERIQKPIVGAHIFAFAITVLIAVGFLIWQARKGWSWVTELTAMPQLQGFHWAALWPFASDKFDGALLALIPSLVLLVLCSGVVLYLTSEKQ